MSIKKYILYLIKDCRTDNIYNQVVGKTFKKHKLNSFIDIKLDLPDNEKEWVLCKVVGIKENVLSLVIVKEI